MNTGRGGKRSGRVAHPHDDDADDLFDADLDEDDDGLDLGSDDGEDLAEDEDDGDEDSRSGPMVLIVVGAHLRAEVADRPIAYWLRDRVLAWLDARFAGDPAVAAAAADVEDADPGQPRPGHPCRVIVCSDVWYLNDASLRVWPTVSIGGPGVNALSAYLADKLPGLLVVDDVLMVQMDPELSEPTASVWGVDHAATVNAAEAFAERYLDAFMSAAVRGWGIE